jgi:hypothetical protein
MIIATKSATLKLANSIMEIANLPPTPLVTVQMIGWAISSVTRIAIWLPASLTEAIAQYSMT